MHNVHFSTIKYYLPNLHKLSLACILDKILKLLTYHTPFYHQSLQSYLISKTVRSFWPTLYVAIM